MSIRYLVDNLIILANLLPQTEAKAKAMGARAARNGGKIVNNPYCKRKATGFRYDSTNMASECQGVAFIIGLSHNERLARAYYLGYGEAIWEQMNKGYRPYIPRVS